MKMETNKIERTKQYEAPILDISPKEGVVRVYINKFNVQDSYNEMSLPGSFTKTFRERLKKMWWLLNHDWEKSLGLTLALEEDTIGAIATGKFNLNKEIARDTFSDYLLFAENSRTLQHSVRVTPIKYIIENDVMKVSEWKQTEWSTLTRPGAIEDTPLISIKQAEDEMELLKKASEIKTYTDERLKEFEEKINQLESLIKAAAESTTLKQSSNDEKIKETINYINKIQF